MFSALVLFQNNRLNVPMFVTFQLSKCKVLEVADVSSSFTLQFNLEYLFKSSVLSILNTFLNQVCFVLLC